MQIFMILKVFEKLSDFKYTVYPKGTAFPRPYSEVHPDQTRSQKFAVSLSVEQKSSQSFWSAM